MTLNEYYELDSSYKINIDTLTSLISTIPDFVYIDLIESYKNNTTITTTPILNTSQVTDAKNCFQDAKFKVFDSTLWDVSKLTNCEGLLRGCDELVFVNLEGFRGVPLTNVKYMFYYCNCCFLDLTPLDISNLTSLSSMCQYMKKLTTFKIGDTSHITDFSYFLSGANNLCKVPLMNMSSTTNMNSFFQGWDECKLLTDIEGFVNLKCKWDDNNGLAKCPNVSRQSYINIFSNLYDFTGNGETPTSSQGKIKLHPNYLTVCTQEDIDIALRKGWQISV